MAGRKTVTTTHGRFTVDESTSDKTIRLMQAPYEKIISINDARTGAPLEQHYTVPEVAAALKVDERTVRAWIEAGKLKAVRVGRHYRIPASAIEAMK